MKKRLLSALLCLCMVAGMLPAVTQEAQASTNGYSQADAVAWIRSSEGTANDIDHFAGVQCVDLVNWYIRTLGHSLGSIGYAYNLYKYTESKLNLPSWGWSRHYNNEAPQPGDIVVFDAGAYGASGAGHCGLIYNVDVNAGKYYYIDYNGGGHNEGGTRREKPLYNFSCVIRPDWPNSYPTAQQYLGGDFYAYINYPNGNLNLENRDGNVQTATVNTSDPRQVWHFIHHDNGSYEIINMYDGLRLDLKDDIRADEKNIRVWPDNDTPAQRWNIVNDAGGQSGSYNLLPYGESNYSLDVENAGTSSGTNVQLYTRNATPAQAFKINPISDIGSTLANNNLDSDFYAQISYSGSYLQTTGEPIPDGSGYGVDVRTTRTSNTSDPNQIWHFVRQPNGSYKIVNMGSGWCLDVRTGIAENKKNVWTWHDDHGGLPERWYLFSSPGENTYRFVSAVNYPWTGENNLYSIDIPAGSTSQGTNVEIYQQNANAWQRFTITEVSYRHTCKVELLTSPVTGGTVTGAGTYEKGTSVTVEAVAYDGCEFVEWQKNGRKVSGIAVYEFTVDADITLTAVFDVPPVTGTIYPITVIASPSEGGTVGITTKTSPAEGGKSGDEKFAVGGEEAIVTATPNAGYVFTGWKENDRIVDTDASYTFTVNAERYLFAVFEPEGPTVPTVPTITEWPAASAVYYGQKLSDSTLSGEQASVRGTCQWNDPSATPRPGQSYSVTFTPSDTEKYSTVSGTVYVPVNKTDPELELRVSKDPSGTSVTVSVWASNPYDASLDDVPAPVVTCRIGNGAAQTVSGGSFTIPEGTENGTVITVTASITGNEYYQAAEKTETLTVSGIPDKTIYYVLKTSGSDLGGTVTIQPERATRGETVTVTATPRAGYTLEAVTAKDADGAAVSLTSRGDGWYTFVMPGSDVILDVAFGATPDDWINPFSDIVERAWYYDAVKFVSRSGLMQGNGDKFSPDENLSRAMVAQILYNWEDRPAVTEGQAFSDVPSGEWYTDAVKWAAGKRLVQGNGTGLFSPVTSITLEDFAVILWRYAGQPAFSGGTLNFTDAGRISYYAREAVGWAAENGIINGSNSGVLDPTRPATRAQVAQMLKNYLDR